MTTLAIENKRTVDLVTKMLLTRHSALDLTEAAKKAKIDNGLDSYGAAIIFLAMQMLAEQMKYRDSKVEEIDEAFRQYASLNR